MKEKLNPQALSVFYERVESLFSPVLSRLEGECGVRSRILPIPPGSQAYRFGEVAQILKEHAERLVVPSRLSLSLRLATGEEIRPRPELNLEEDGEALQVPVLFYVSLGGASPGDVGLFLHTSFHYEGSSYEEGSILPPWLKRGEDGKVYYFQDPWEDLDLAHRFFGDNMESLGLCGGCETPPTSKRRVQQALSLYGHLSQVGLVFFSVAHSVRLVLLRLLEEAHLAVGEERPASSLARHLPLLLSLYLPKPKLGEDEGKSWLSSLEEYRTSLLSYLSFSLRNQGREGIERDLFLVPDLVSSLPGSPMEVLPWIQAKVHVPDGPDPLARPNLAVQREGWFHPLLLREEHSLRWVESGLSYLSRVRNELQHRGAYNVSLRESLEMSTYLWCGDSENSLSQALEAAHADEILSGAEAFTLTFSGRRWDPERVSQFEREVSRFSSFFTGHLSEPIREGWLRSDLVEIRYRKLGEAGYYPFLSSVFTLKLGVSPDIHWEYVPPYVYKTNQELFGSLRSEGLASDSSFAPWNYAFYLDRESLGVSLLLFSLTYALKPFYAYYAQLPRRVREQLGLDMDKPSLRIHMVQELVEYPPFSRNLERARRILEFADEGLLSTSVQEVLQASQDLYGKLGPGDFVFPLISLEASLCTFEFCDPPSLSEPLDLALPVANLTLYVSEGALDRAWNEIRRYTLSMVRALSDLAPLRGAEFRLQKF